MAYKSEVEDNPADLLYTRNWNKHSSMMLKKKELIVDIKQSEIKAKLSCNYSTKSSSLPCKLNNRRSNCPTFK